MSAQKSPKPIRVFYSTLSNRFYATRTYKQEPNGLVTITGEKFDVTNDIAELIERHLITFQPQDMEQPPDTARAP